MNSWLEWKLALRNLSRNRRRSFSTAVALLLAYVGLVLISGHGFRTERTIVARFVYMRYLGHIAIYKNKGVENFESYPDKYQITDQELQKVEEVLKPYHNMIDKTGKFLSTPGLLSTGNKTIPVVVEGVQPDIDDYGYKHPFAKKWAPETAPEPGEPTWNDFYKKDPLSISIANGVSELLGRLGSVDKMSNTDKELVLAGRSVDGSLNAVNASLAMKHDTALPYVDDVHVAAPLEMVRELMQISGISHMALFLKDEGKTAELVKTLNQELKNQGLDLEALPFYNDRVGHFYAGTMSFLVVMISFFAILIFGASGLIVVNSVTMGVLERSREIGTLRSLGFTPERVRGFFIKESFWLSIFSAVLGILLSEIVIALINAREFKFEASGVKGFLNVHLYVPFWYHLVMSAVMVGISMSASYWAVSKKAKEKISHLLLESGAAV